MLVSKKAISYLIPEIMNISDDLITKAFNNSGCEVERVIKHNKVNNLVIGKILKVENHPNANRLHVCTVQINPDGLTHTIVCGASNLVEQKYVIVALQGAQMVDGREIQYKELRGILSQGMICAYNELTTQIEFLSDSEKDNIILLDDGIIGDTNIEQYINTDDTIYDLSLPSNRNDLNSIYSICQELNGYFKLNFVNKIAEGIFTDNTHVNVALNSVYAFGLALLEIDNFEVKESPWFIKSFLMNNGIVPQNNLLDKLSIISLYTNTSIQVYDADKVGGVFKVDINKDSMVATINNKEYNILANDIIVSNKNNVIGLAGIGVFDQFAPSIETSKYLIEIGNYDFKSIRTTINRLNIPSVNGKRLTKQMSNWHIKQALGLFNKVFEGFKIDKIFEQLKIDPELKLNLDFNEANDFLGINIDKNTIKDSLLKFGYQFENDDIVIPSYRIDIQIYQDVYEEILKVADVDKIKGAPIITDIALNDKNTEYTKISEIKSLLNSNYFTETKSYNLVSKDELEEFNIFGYKDFIKIANPLNSSREYLRTNLIGSLLDVYKFNISYKNNLQPIFEVQKIYFNNMCNLNLTAICEDHICLDKVNKSNIIYNVDSLKSIINSIGNLFGVKFDYFANKSSSCMYNDEMLSIYLCGQLVGYVGRIKQSKLQKYNLNNKQIYMFTLNLNLLFDMYSNIQTKVEYWNNLIPVYKDVSYVCDLNKNTVDVKKELEQLQFISSFEFIDLFKLEDGKYSYTIRIYFDNSQKLSTNQIDEYLKQIHTCLIKLHCEVRK